jgi:hypothetical protein
VHFEGKSDISMYPFVCCSEREHVKLSILDMKAHVSDWDEMTKDGFLCHFYRLANNGHKRHSISCKRPMFYHLKFEKK